MRPLTRLDRAKSTSRYRPPNGTAGLARSAVSGASRLPAPPASTIPSIRGSAISRLLDDVVTEHAVENLLRLLLDASQMIGAPGAPPRRPCRQPPYRTAGPRTSLTWSPLSARRAAGHCPARWSAGQ